MAYRSQRKFKQQQREYEFLQDRAADESFGEDDPLSEAEKASQWDDFNAFHDDKCLREVDTLFDRMFGVAR